jgi:hypothetical protein
MARDFIPTTCERKVSGKIVFRPIKSWHGNTYAGEGLKIHNGDRSGCLKDSDGVLEQCYKPLTVTHRVYWHRGNPEEEVSAFLSYPNGMGAMDCYFWEAYITRDTPRFTSEEEMERKVVRHLNYKFRKFQEKQKEMRKAMRKQVKTSERMQLLEEKTEDKDGS